MYCGARYVGQSARRTFSAIPMPQPENRLRPVLRGHGETVSRLARPVQATLAEGSFAVLHCNRRWPTLQITPAWTSSVSKSKVKSSGIGISALNSPRKSRTRMACSDELPASAEGRTPAAPAATAIRFPNCRPRERERGPQSWAGEHSEFQSVRLSARSIRVTASRR